jgi:phosphoadenosine phosphosulfate reductase
MINIGKLKEEFFGKGPSEIISIVTALFSSDDIVFATSLGAEDQVITHFIAESGKDIRIFTLDTGRLHEETYQLLEKTNARYGIQIEIYFPDQKLVEEMVSDRGVNLFYKNVEDRKRCCLVRKLEPLERALGSAKVWITGLRREQAVTRVDVGPVEFDSESGLIKVNPLYDWTTERLWDFIKINDIPYNPLHDRGFSSIGCAPCTRAVKDGEDLRAGRWWWEIPEHRECGLHRKKRERGQ